MLDAVFVLVVAVVLQAWVSAMSVWFGATTWAARRHPELRWLSWPSVCSLTLAWISQRLFERAGHPNALFLCAGCWMVAALSLVLWRRVIAPRASLEPVVRPTPQ